MFGVMMFVMAADARTSDPISNPHKTEQLNSIVEYFPTHCDSEEDRAEANTKRLLKFDVSVSVEDLILGDIVELAKDFMGITDADILRLELSGPDNHI
jgi:hypothetical protein